MVSYKPYFVVSCLLILVSCVTPQVILPDNTYTPSTLLAKEEFLKQLKLVVLDAKNPIFVGHMDEIFLDLGDLPEGGMKDYMDGKALALYFSYNPNDDFYGIKYHKMGVYGGSFERRTIKYIPQNHTLIRAREGSRIKFNETWTCMTFQDIVAWADSGNVETDCYSYVSN